MHRTRYHFLEETTSTNDEARNPRYGHGDAICAERQTAGRGQRGHTWSSEEGRNLMFSLVWEPRFLPVSEQFLLSEAVALALTDLFGGYGIDARIKWTNDIYAGDRKLVGILIEHNLTGDRLSRTIVGIGVNVNQTRFDPSLPNPSSMCLETGCEYDRQEVLHRLGDCLAALPISGGATGRLPAADVPARRAASVPLSRRPDSGGRAAGRAPFGRATAGAARRPYRRVPVPGDRVRYRGEADGSNGRDGLRVKKITG